MSYKNEIQTILPVLTSGGIILYPTDTIWGIGCNAMDKNAVKRIFELKQRKPEKSFVLLVSSVEMLSKYVGILNPKINSLLEFHERPVTVIYENPKHLSPAVIAGDNTVGIRIAKDDFCRALIDALGHPLVATSANISNDPHPENFSEMNPAIIEGVDYVVKHRQDDTSKHLPSVIVKVSAKNDLIFLRD